MTDLPATLEARLRPGGCALIVVDMQNDFCAQGGYIDKLMAKDVSAVTAVVPALQHLIDAARRTRVPVVWLRADYSRARIPNSMRVKLEARLISVDCCQPGTWGADWFGVRPEAADTVVTKHSYSGFVGTDLAARLKTMGVRTLVFCGVQTQVCIESTVRDAHSLGYFCVVPRDAVASHTPALHDATLINIGFLFGDVCGAADVEKAWPGNTA